VHYPNSKSNWQCYERLNPQIQKQSGETLQFSTHSQGVGFTAYTAGVSWAEQVFSCPTQDKHLYEGDH